MRPSPRAHLGGGARELGFNDRGVANQDQLERRIGDESTQRTGYAFRRTAVTTHHIDGD
jgi:hypothetical protein